MAGPTSVGGSTLRYGLPRLDDGTGAGVKAINEDWFSTPITQPNIPTGMVLPIDILFSIDTNAKVEITVNGTDYQRLNSDQNIPAKSASLFGFLLDNNSQFNIRSPTALTVDLVLVASQV